MTGGPRETRTGTVTSDDGEYRWRAVEATGGVGGYIYELDDLGNDVACFRCEDQEAFWSMVHMLTMKDDRQEELVGNIEHIGEPQSDAFANTYNCQFIGIDNTTQAADE